MRLPTEVRQLCPLQSSKTIRLHLSWHTHLLYLLPSDFSSQLKKSATLDSHLLKHMYLNGGGEFCFTSVSPVFLSILFLHAHQLHYSILACSIFFILFSSVVKFYVVTHISVKVSFLQHKMNHVPLLLYIIGDSTLTVHTWMCCLRDHSFAVFPLPLSWVSLPTKPAVPLEAKLVLQPCYSE